MRDLTLEPFQHGLKVSVLQPKFANRLAAQELYVVIEAEGLTGKVGAFASWGPRLLPLPCSRVVLAHGPAELARTLGCRASPATLLP
jgi:hypothetical protein